MSNRPMIFTVFVAQLQQDGTYRLRMHLVAATSSAQAEKALDRQARYGHLKGECFITTDEIMELYPSKDVHMYVSELTNSTMSQREFNSWKRRITASDFNSDTGETFPASFRQFR